MLKNQDNNPKGKKKGGGGRIWTNKSQKNGTQVVPKYTKSLMVKS